ncbi:MAG TPA: hypothetical protein VJ963_03560 [Bacteroidales bacterium]|nr:hypothetical protein [Bacteroidales bacterium]
MKTLKILKFTGFAILGIGFVFLAVFLTMSLWNALIPSLFHGPVLTFWQTAGLFILSKILLTGVAPGHHESRRKKVRSDEWREHYRERFCKEQGNKEEAKTGPA